MTDLTASIQHSASLQGHVCPWQVLAIRMGHYGAELLGLDVPRADRRLVALVELDGCFADGILAATGCRIGHRTLRLVDHGKLAATFVDADSGRAVRITPDPLADLYGIETGPTGHRTDLATYVDVSSLPHTRLANELAGHCDTLGRDWREEQIVAYRDLPNHVLLRAQPVALATPLASVVGNLRARTLCARCGDEVRAEREVVVLGQRICRSCAGDRYFLPLSPLTASGIPPAYNPSGRLVTPEAPRPVGGPATTPEPTFMLAG